MLDLPRGRPKGTPKSGGRVKGSVNKTTAAKIAEIAASGLTPLDFMMNVMRDEARDFDQRFEAAKAAAPYSHAKLSAVDASLEANATMQIVIQRFNPEVGDGSN